MARISHGNVSRLAAAQGDDNLAKICRKIAADEARHEAFYTRVMGEIMERDPEGGMIAYRMVLKGIVAMPGREMFDGRDPDLFEHFSAVTQRNGVYTIQDYARIIAHLNEVWGVGRRSVSGKAAKAQDYLCQQPERYERLAGEIADGLAAQPPPHFAWLNGVKV
ncbi:MAG: acyl-ACP desaturase [Planctomycetia bacterium]|nr:acyl-ACP desaturase [Planctomycetia bacterium]